MRLQRALVLLAVASSMTFGCSDSTRDLLDGGDADADGDGDIDADADGDGDSDGDGDGDGDIDADADGDGDGDIDADADADVEVPCDTPGTVETVPCGSCGTVERFCTGDHLWAYGECVEEGECIPGETDTEPCGDCGVQNLRCNDSCTWVRDGACTDEGECTPGDRTRTTEGCPDGQTREVLCSDLCVYDEVSPCVGDECRTPGELEVVSCGDCGEQERFCTAEHIWAYGACEEMGECTPGTSEDVTCGLCGVQTMRCNASCEWFAAGDCMDEGECEPGTSVTTRDGCPAGQTRVLECQDDCTFLEVEPCADEDDLDVVLLFDMTGSHATEVAGMLGTILTGIVDPLLALDVAVGVAAYADFPVDPYGSAGDEPFVGVLEPVTDRDMIRAALRALPAMGGNDAAESGVEALSVLSGGSVHPLVETPMDCSAGRVTGGCWRTGATHAVVMFTDQVNHNGPDPYSDALYGAYSGIAPAPAEWPDVGDQMVADGCGLFVRIPPDAILPFDFISPQYEEMLTDLGQPSTHVDDFADFADLVTLIQDFAGL